MPCSAGTAVMLGECGSPRLAKVPSGSVGGDEAASGTTDA